MVSIDDYKEVRDCIYKDEHYSVRDNGAIMRHQREGMRKRKNDNVWSFGNPSDATGYMLFCGESVLRIVSTAFHGPAPSGQHVVDHIDTNRRNNRPENLRWLTKLENILNNEITRKKVELICGSIEAFLKNPSLLYGYEIDDKNFSWMRQVTKEEAKQCLENWNNWARSVPSTPHYRKERSHIGNWIFDATSKSNPTTPLNNSQEIVDTHPIDTPSSSADLAEVTDRTTIGTSLLRYDTDKIKEFLEKDDYWPDSLTPSAKQRWRTRTEFPCCPPEVTEDGLEIYNENIKGGQAFSINKYDTYYVIESKVVKDKEILAILSTNKNDEGVMGTYSICAVKQENGFFVHYSLRRFGSKMDAYHFYKVLIGEEVKTEEDEILWDT
jgi:hypothetical protein